MKRRRIWMVMTALAAVLALGACNGNGGDEDTGTDGDVAEDTGEPDTGEPGDTETPDGTGDQDTGGNDTWTPDDTGMDTGGMDTGTDGGDTGPPAYEEVDCSSVEAAETVDVVDNSFQPAEVTVSPGDVVQWSWSEENAMGHSVTSGNTDSCTPNGEFDSGTQSSGSFNYCIRFNETGEVPYFCTPHCAAGMTGAVVVSE